MRLGGVCKRGWPTKKRFDAHQQSALCDIGATAYSVAKQMLGMSSQTVAKN